MYELRFARKLFEAVPKLQFWDSNLKMSSFARLKA
jgi:hypothetical protein